MSLQVIAARQASMRKRTSAGLAAVDAMGPGTIVALLLVAVLALAWAHGVAAVQAAAWLIRCRAAAGCVPTCALHDYVA